MVVVEEAGMVAGLLEAGRDLGLPRQVRQGGTVPAADSSPPEEDIGLAADNIPGEHIAPEEDIVPEEAPGLAGVHDLVVLGDIVHGHREEGLGRKAGSHSQAAAAVAAAAAAEGCLSGYDKVSISVCYYALYIGGGV